MSPNEETAKNTQDSTVKKLFKWLHIKKTSIRASRYVIVGLLVVILIAVMSLLTASGINGIFPANWQGIRLSNLTQLGPHSQAQLSLTEESSTSGKLQINFNILPSDQIKVTNISNRLGIGQEWLQGISVQLNKATIDKLKTYLPISVELTLEDDQVQFTNGRLLVLNSGLPVRTEQYASGSGSMILKSQSEKNFELDIKDPGVVVSSAIAEGKLTVSPQLDSLRLVLDQIAEIHLKMANDQVDGFIRLK